MWMECMYTHKHTHLYKEFACFDSQGIYTHICKIDIYTHTLLRFLLLFIDFFFLFGVYPGTPRTICLCEGIRQHCGIMTNVALSILFLSLSQTLLSRQHSSLTSRKLNPTLA